MVGEEIEDDNIDVGDIDSMRPAVKELVITRHIEMILEDGAVRCSWPKKERLSNPSCESPMLRGSVESFIPFTEASRFYEIGQEVETNPESAEKLAAEVDEIVDELFSSGKN